jgi:Ulp1 family protease
MKIHRRKPSLFFNIGFITFNNTNNPKCNTNIPRFARGKNLFDMRYIFIPIHHGLHFTCAVIYMVSDSEELHALSSKLLAIKENNLNSPHGRISKREVFM